MSRKKKHAEHANHERWLVSYADFITLLFAFFVVLYSSSQVDKKKMGQLSGAIQQAFQQLGVFEGKSVAPALDEGSAGADPSKGISKEELAPLPAEAKRSGPPDRQSLGDLQREIEKALAPEIQRHEIAVRRGPEGLIVSLREIGFFDSGSARMRRDSEDAFTRIATLLHDYSCEIRVEGHTDNVPIHNGQFASNWELSTARATEIIRLLITRYDVAPGRLSAAGFGEFHPVASNSNEEGRRQNRRIDIVVLGTMTEQNRRSAQVTAASSGSR